MTGNHRQDGFTLLETLVALVIVALALGAAAQTISMAARSYATASESERVQQLADRLSLEMRSSNGKQFARQGAEGGLRWSVDTRSVGTAGEARLVILTIDPRLGRDQTFLFFETGSGADE